MGKTKALFLDRDGTINEDPGYISDPDQLALIPGVAGAIKRLVESGYRPIVISNQSGVGRGLIPPDALSRIHQRLNGLLGSGAEMESFRFCVHVPDAGCACRKPSPQLILDAAAELGIDLEKSVMVGDRRTDLQAGRNAKVGRVALVRTGEGLETEKKIDPNECDFIGNSLVDVANWLLGPQKAENANF